jgi:Zn-dependent peptidase ImmA (M78 family)
MPNKEKPEEAAARVLKDYGVKAAPVPVEKIAKSLGAELRYSPLDDELSGMVYIKDGADIIGVNSLHHINRQRFTIAHEIGHLTLHREHMSSAVHVDKIFQRGILATLGSDQFEIEANRFAAALLIPDEFLKNEVSDERFDIDDDRPMDRLAKLFKVSRQMLEYRIQNFRV